MACGCYLADEICRTMKQYLVEHQPSRCLNNVLIPFLQVPCKAKKEKRPDEKPVKGTSFPLSIPHTQVYCYSSVFDVPHDWDRLINGVDVFLERPYLSTLESNPPKDMGFVYLLFYYKNKAIGLAYCQTFPISLEDSIRSISAKRSWEKKVKSWIGRTFGFHMLVCGNALLSGQHQLYVDESKIEAALFYDLLQEGLDVTAKWLRSCGTKVDTIMVKDLENKEQAFSEKLANARYHICPFQPSMILNLQEDWETFDDYLAAMSSKYRVRARRAFKKGTPLERIELDREDLEIYQSELFDLYKSVADKAEFSLTELHPEYLPALKKKFGADFIIQGYFVQGEMIGYCTTLQNGTELEAHFLGIGPDTNQKYQLYLNMLYDMVKIGIEKQMQRIIFSRTALEIKSSIGAEPESLGCYLRYRNPIFNHFLSFFVHYMEPQVDWEQRHPFKNIEQGTRNKEFRMSK